ncbi:glycosyltransferase family 4 protein [Pseudooceanicola sp. C21-150M6]|uniref:glycosyltransferase family 4 protein n=1 Tax=Pseudooceanicola sp. C21-150M6 TaxID=3434355 RepID=UPI003D7F972F
MTLRRAAFAVPGDITTPTGGYIYERRLLDGLRAQGRDLRHLELGGSFPDPTEQDMGDAIAQLQALEPDRAVILDGFVSATLDTGALAGLHVPAVAMVHHPLAFETGLPAARRDHLFEIERRNLAHIAHVLVPSPSTAALLVRAYDVRPDRITIARPGTIQPSRPPAPTDPPLILSVGIQHPRKGHDILLQALGRITDLDWSAVIAGKAYDAAHAAELGELLDRLDLHGRVALRGFVPDRDLAGHYGAASIFALATRFEGYGLVFDEALAHGLPIVSCRTGAVPDTVPPEAGLLVAPDDPGALADALSYLLTHPDQRARLAEAAGAWGRRLPGWSETAQIAGQVLDRI